MDKCTHNIGGKSKIDLDISSLDAPCLFNREIYNNFLRKTLNIKVEYDSYQKTFPNICTPLAGIIDYYKKKNILFNFVDLGDQNGYGAKTRFWDPYIVEKTSSDEISYPFDKVWKFSTPEGVQRIMNSFVEKIRCSEIVEPGILQGITWCINETLDNVLQHANTDSGFVMGQIHKDSHRVVVAIFDSGRGILKSFRDSNYCPLPKSPKDAITLALQENVTRDKAVGQGNGMWGLAQLVQNNGGALRISSGGAGLIFDTTGHHDMALKQCLSLGEEHGTTLVDFQLNYKEKIDVDEVLGNPMIDVWLDNHENPSGTTQYSIAEDCEGTGTRLAAERLRNIIINGYKENKTNIEIDFSGINFVSSSFSDELLGKLVASFGIVNFLRIFTLSNVSNQIETTINRSIEQRLAQKYYDPSIPDPND